MKLILCTTSLIAMALSASAVTADFSDVTVPAAGFTIGTGEGSTFVSSGITFTVNNHSGYWDGIGCANLASDRPTSEEYGTGTYYVTGQYRTVAQITPAVAYNYAVVYDAGAYGTPPTITLPDGLDCPESITLANSSYAWASMNYGDFAGKIFADGDWFKLTIKGFDAEDEETGSVDVYLADFRAGVDAADHFIMDWTKVDLSSLGTNVKTIEFALSSSDSGAYGMNTPGYFTFASVEAYGTYLWPVVGAWDETWYGSVYAYQNGEGWIYSSCNAAWQYAVGNADGSAYFFDPLLGWSYTDHSTFPYVYLYDLGGWAWTYDADGTAANRWFCLFDDTLDGSFTEYPYATAQEIAAFDPAR